jgi:hypothetical protein
MMKWPVALRNLAATIVSLAFLLGGAAQSHAAYFSTQSAIQTTSGQNFSFLFSGLPESDGTGAIITIHARGDYGKLSTDEFLSWDINSMGIGGNAGPALGGTTIIQEYQPTPFNDTEWTQSFSISGTDLFTALVGDALTVSLDLNFANFSGVTCCFPNTGTPFVSASVHYHEPVPEPTAALLFAVGFVAISRVRKG